MHQPSKRQALSIVVGLVAIAALGLWGARFRHSVAPAVAGVVRETEIRIAPEVSGRLATVLVKPGQPVARNEPLAQLSNPELSAAVEEARARVGKAMSDRDRVYAGVRQEEVDTLGREIIKAQAALTLALQDLARKSALVTRSDASVQALDETRAEAARAAADVAVAQERYAEAQTGPTREERALADAQVKAAEAARDVVEARAAKLLLHAPTAGAIGIVVPEIGEAVVPGEPGPDLASRTWAMVRLQPAGGRVGQFGNRIAGAGRIAGCARPDAW